MNSSLCQQVIDNLSNIHTIHSNYSLLSFSSNLQLLHRLSQFECDQIQTHSDTLQQSHVLSESLKRPSNTNLDSYRKTFKLRKFDTKISNIPNIDISKDSNLNFLDLLPLDNEISPEKMNGLIDLSVCLFNFELKNTNNNELCLNLSNNDILIIETLSKNIRTLLLTANNWLSKELLRNCLPFNDKTRFFLILNSLIQTLQTENSINIIITDDEMKLLWEKFINKIPIITHDLIDHIAFINEQSIALTIDKSFFLNTFKKIIINNIENKEIAFYALSKFLQSTDSDAFNLKIIDLLWEFEEFQPEIINYSILKLDFIRKNKDSTNETLVLKMKDHAKFLLLILKFKPDLIIQIFLSFCDLAPIAQNFILEKFQFLEKKNLLDYITYEIFIEILENSENSEGLISKLIDRFSKNPNIMGGPLLLPKITSFCINNDCPNIMIPLCYMLTNELEFLLIIEKLIILNKEEYFFELIKDLYEKNRFLIRILFIKIHESYEEKLAKDQLKFLANIHKMFFFQNEALKIIQNNFFTKEEILNILQQFTEIEKIPSLIMLTLIKTFQVFTLNNIEIYVDLVIIIENLIKRLAYKDKIIWDGMKLFLGQMLLAKKEITIVLVKKLPKAYRDEILETLTLKAN